MRTVCGFLSLVMLLALAWPAQSAVIETNDWGNRTQAGWEYSTPTGSPPPNNQPVLDASPACGPSPSGGGTIRGTFYPGTFTQSHAGGTSTYVIPANQSYTDLYYGFFLCIGNPFNFHPIGTKFSLNFNRTPTVGDVGTGRDNWVINFNPNGAGAFITAQLWFANFPFNTRNWPFNKGNISFQKLRWYWFEIHARMNTIGNGYSSSQDGLLEVWVDDVLMMQHFNVVLRTNNSAFGTFANTPIMGGGWASGHNVPVEEYLWYDHDVLSTTRIGRPDGTLPTDLVPGPPGPVTGFTVQ